MASISSLASIVAHAHSEQSTGYQKSITDFVRAAKDDKFLAHAKSEHDRLIDLEKNIGCPLSMRCYASAHQLAFLKAALPRVQHAPDKKP